MTAEQPIREWITTYLEEHFDCRCLQEIEVGKFEPFDLSGEAAKDFLAELNRRLDEIENPYKNDITGYEEIFNEAIQAMKEMLK